MVNLKKLPIYSNSYKSIACIDTYIQNPSCFEYGANLFYKVNLNSSGTMQQSNINHANCNTNSCRTVVGNFIGPTNECSISVKADSFSKVYPFSISKYIIYLIFIHIELVFNRLSEAALSYF